MSFWVGIEKNFLVMPVLYMEIIMMVGLIPHKLMLNLQKDALL